MNRDCNHARSSSRTCLLDYFNAAAGEKVLANAPPVDTIVVDECDVFFKELQDPDAALLVQLRPLDGVTWHRGADIELAHRHNKSHRKIELLNATLKKLKTSGFLPTNLQLPVSLGIRFSIK
jgi:hypothetical protein